MSSLFKDKDAVMSSHIIGNIMMSSHIKDN